MTVMLHSVRVNDSGLCRTLKHLRENHVANIYKAFRGSHWENFNRYLKTLKNGGNNHQN